MARGVRGRWSGCRRLGRDGARRDHRDGRRRRRGRGGPLVPRLDRRDGDRHHDADDTDDDRIDPPASRPEPDRVEVDAHRRDRSAREWDDPALGIDGRLAPCSLELGAGDLVARVVARPDERRGLDVLEPERRAPRSSSRRTRRGGSSARGADAGASGAGTGRWSGCRRRPLAGPRTPRAARRASRPGRPSASSWCGPGSRSRRPSPWPGAGRTGCDPSGRACGPASGAASRSRGCG